MRKITSLFIASVAATAVYGYPGSVSNNYANNPPNYNSCYNCHDSYSLNSGNGTVQVQGLPGDGYVSGQEYDLTLRIDHNGRDRWGFQLTVEYFDAVTGSWIQGGQLIRTDTQHTSLSNQGGNSPDFLKHTNSGTYNNQANWAEWDFAWEAPAGSETATFYYSVLACNGTGGTSSDYCYNYSTDISAAQGGQNDVTIDLTPVPGSTTIPAGGGVLAFNIAVANNEPNTMITDIWTMITLPSGNEYGPLLNVQNFGLLSGANPDRDRTQTIPGGAPAGVYMYDGYTGVYPDEVWGEDHFQFEKTGFDNGGVWYSGWQNRGEDFNEVNSETLNFLPSEHLMISAYPNPFNNQATIEYSLENAGKVLLTVFDVQGRMVIKLAGGWRSSGNYSDTFDGEDLPGGVYFIRLQTAGELRIQKIVMVK